MESERKKQYLIYMASLDSYVQIIYITLKYKALFNCTFMKCIRLRKCFIESSCTA